MAPCLLVTKSSPPSGGLRKDDHADGYRSGSGLIRSNLVDLELPSQKNRNFITIWRSWFSYEFPLV